MKAPIITLEVGMIHIIFKMLPCFEPSRKISESRRSREAIARVTPYLRTELKRKGLEYGAAIFIRIFKETEELEVWVEKGKKYEFFKKYTICYFSGDLGPKLKVGDQQSPEGFYFVTPSPMSLT